MLMFVGENLEAISIASRREESAWQAPAVAHVITRKSLAGVFTFPFTDKKTIAAILSY